MAFDPICDDIISVFRIVSGDDIRSYADCFIIIKACLTDAFYIVLTVFRKICVSLRINVDLLASFSFKDCYILSIIYSLLAGKIRIL